MIEMLFCLLHMLALAPYCQMETIPKVQPSSVQTAKLVGTGSGTLK